jgi:hypothetical protein
MRLSAAVLLLLLQQVDARVQGGSHPEDPIRPDDALLAAIHTAGIPTPSHPTLGTLYRLLKTALEFC